MRHAPRNLRLACDHRGLTHFGGIYFFREFLRVLQLRNFRERYVKHRFYLGAGDGRLPGVVEFC